MENNLFQQAKEAVTNFMDMQQGTENEEERQVTNEAIQAAYEDASPEEQEQLQQLEQQLKQKNHLK